MIRLWHRVGVFRMLAVAVLVLGVVGGIYLSADRKSHQREILSAQNAQSTQEESRELRLLAADRERTEAASRAAQREAQAKADTAAAAAAEQARLAEQAAKDKKPPAPPGRPPAIKPPPPFGPIPTSCQQYTGNRAIGCALMLQWGYGLDQFPCLEKLWTKESGWRTEARNPSGALGIAQALPGSKMKSHGADYATSAQTQIKWGLDYIKGRYKTPCGAYSYFQSHNYY